MTDLSRRKMLAALGGTGIAAFTGFVYTTDDSVRYTQASSHSCEDYTLNAEWRETYTSDGGTSILEDTTDSNNGTETDDPAIIHLENILPGDRGTISFRLGAERTNDSASSTVTPTLGVIINERAENGISDAEGEAGDQDNTGELQDHLDVKLWNNNGILGLSSLGADDLDQDITEDTIEEGTLEEVANNLNGRELEQLNATSDDTTSVTLRWEFADSADVNVTQTDSVTFTLDINCTQQ